MHLLLSTTIATSLETCWQVITNIEHCDQWITSIQQIETLTKPEQGIEYENRYEERLGSVWVSIGDSLQRCPGVNVRGRAVLIGKVIDGDVLSNKLAVTVFKMIHGLTSFGERRRTVLRF